MPYLHACAGFPTQWCYVPRTDQRFLARHLTNSFTFGAHTTAHSSMSKWKQLEKHHQQTYLVIPAGISLSQNNFSRSTTLHVPNYSSYEKMQTETKQLYDKTSRTSGCAHHLAQIVHAQIHAEVISTMLNYLCSAMLAGSSQRSPGHSWHKCITTGEAPPTNISSNSCRNFN